MSKKSRVQLNDITGFVLENGGRRMSAFEAWFVRRRLEKNMKQNAEKYVRMVKSNFNNVE